MVRPTSLLPEGYDPAKYGQLKVSGDVKALFDFIGRYQPEHPVLPAHLKLFIPDYLPAIGDVDEFLKPQRPDGAPETLGLRVRPLAL